MGASGVLCEVTSQPQAGALIEFGPFRFDKFLGKLSKHDTAIRLRGMPLTILQHLVERPGEVVSRGELQTLLWKGVAFGDFEQRLNTAVNVVRKTLGDSAADARYIETVPGQGYRFIAPIRSDLPIAQSDTSTAAGLDPLPVDANGEGKRQIREAPERGLKPSPKSRWFVAAGLAGAVFVVAAVALSAWSYLRYTRARHVRTDSLPRIRTLIANDRRVAAYDLTVAALRNAPEDQDLQQLSQEILTRLNLTTTPPGARISYRDYGDVRAPWREIGVTPIKNAQVPIAFLHFRAERPGLPPLELAAMSPALGGANFLLFSKPEGMVFVPAQA
jgi:DNA-binding winged helix-turn-helix (wHTH) protein